MATNPQTLLEALQALADQLSVAVCYETMGAGVSGTGGMCRVRGQYRVIIDRRLGTRERVQILSTALARFDLEAAGLDIAESLRPLLRPVPALAG